MGYDIYDELTNFADDELVSIKEFIDKLLKERSDERASEILAELDKDEV